MKSGKKLNSHSARMDYIDPNNLEFKYKNDTLFLEVIEEVGNGFKIKN